MNKAINYIDIKKFNYCSVNLGCGNIFLDEFVNIDIKDDIIYERKQEPDIYANFTDIYFDKNSLDKIHFSHALEHFQRHESIILLSRFNSWLGNNKILEINVPDINACIVDFITANYKRRKELIRHMWGSHESFWATHHEGYFDENLSELLQSCGFGDVHIKNYNGQWPWINIICSKIKSPDINLIENYLKDYSPFVLGYENNLLNYWMNMIKKEL